MRRAMLLVFLVACGTDDPTACDPPTCTPDGGATKDAAPPDPPSCPAPTSVPVATAPEITVINDQGSTLGIFDPSVVYPLGAPGGAMAYSSVPDKHSIRTRIALSADGGASWTFAAEANAPEAATIASSDKGECPTGTCTGSLMSEVSSLVFDATDPDANARWKLFAHRYLAEANGTLHYALGTITIQTAKDPQGPWTAPAKLFGLDSPSAYTTTDVQYNASKSADTADCLTLTEPSALVLPDGIDLAMGCVYLDGATPRIRIVRARTATHGKSWTGAQRLLDVGDADCLQGTSPGASVNAPDLFIGPDGLEYLLATGSDGAGYHGCLVYKIDDPKTGHVERDASGRVLPLRAFAADDGRFSGACAWSGGGGGLLMDIGFFSGEARQFRIFHAGAFAP
jgi:hypothetical protein